ncbi:glycosyltransferase family 9 protein [Tunturiibacter empetritectus]|uniref:Heptosyltransferase-1 n=1 Tax=Tunturiibacter lichenicola TaxID=2051959 RepID=A0A852VKC4_9BACT|nr:glycosyltransferase family 9 protein [Edaphobacter lichenicola]NYF90884.1 heptosyltransferase-1 [Edaphobacter lichenicola]
MATELTPSRSVANHASAYSRSVLIVRIGAMGDVLHAMPAVAALRQQHPEWIIGWAIEPAWSALLQSSTDFNCTPPKTDRSDGKPLIDRWHSLPARAWSKHPFALSTLAEIKTTRRDLRRSRYDICVDMQGSIKSALVGRMASAPVFAGPEHPRETPARLLYTQRIPTSAKHVVEQGCELLSAAVGETLRPATVTLPVDPKAELWCDRLLAQTSLTEEKFAFLAPTAGWGAKQWPAERYGAVAVALRQAGYHSLVNEAPGHRFADAVVTASEGCAISVPCSVEQMIALQRRAGVVIAGDTGPLHLAATLERPVVGLYGPTDPSRTGPYLLDRSKVRVLRHESSRTDHSRHSDPETGLMQISTEEVVEAALELLRDGQDKVKL